MGNKQAESLSYQALCPINLRKDIGNPVNKLKSFSEPMARSLTYRSLQFDRHPFRVSLRFVALLHVFEDINKALDWLRRSIN